MPEPRRSTDLERKLTIVSPTRPIAPVTLSTTHLLRQLQGAEAPRDVALDTNPVVIGRSRTCDLSIQSAELSRRHAVLRREGNDFVIEDLDSQNGVYLNGVRVHSAVLRGGDTIHIADIAFLYLEGM
jgi:pSer/pThr/pTyr-binding forkhead associated (FHA) protein